MSVDGCGFLSPYTVPARSQACSSPRDPQPFVAPHPATPPPHLPTPLVSAASGGHTQAVSTLLAAGLNPAIADKSTSAVVPCRSPPLHPKPTHSHPPMDPSRMYVPMVSSGGWTALFCAAIGQHVGCLRALLAVGGRKGSAITVQVWNLARHARTLTRTHTHTLTRTPPHRRRLCFFVAPSPQQALHPPQAACFVSCSPRRLSLDWQPGRHWEHLRPLL